MSQTSNWPLPASSTRFLVPKNIIAELSLNVLTRGLYPLAFGYYQEAQGHQVTRNKHTDTLLIVCTQGLGTVFYGNNKIQLKKGQGLILPKDVPHRYQADKIDPWSIYWVHMDGHLVEHFLSMIIFDNDMYLFDIPNYRHLLADFEQLLTCRHSTYQFANFILASNLLKKMMAGFISSYQEPLTAEHNLINMQAVDGFLEENINNQVSLEQMADACGLSKFHFAKKFQKQIGVSPVKYFLELKIKHACELIDRTNLSIKEVANQLGYDDPYYFSRLFKKIMGLSPKAYRSLHH